MSDTTVFSIRYLDAAGLPQKMSIEARSAREARELSRIPESRVEHVGRDLFGQMLSEWRRKKPSLDVQANILNVYSAIIRSGARVGESFDNVVSGYPQQFGDKLARIGRLDLVSEKMAELGFDRQIVLLARVGESTNQLGEVLSGAADDMIERRRVLMDMVKTLVPTLLILGLGLIVLTVVPIFVVEPLTDAIDSPGIIIRTNVLTDFLLFMGVFVPLWWWAMLGALVLAAATTRQWWPLVKGLPGMVAIDNFARVTNAYAFISAFLPLYSRGIPPEKALKTAREYSMGPVRRAFDRVLERLGAGKSISAAFSDDDYWHPTLRDAMRQFVSVGDADKVQLLERLKKLLLQQISQAGLRIAWIYATVGMILSIGTVLAMFFGMMWPLMTISTERPGF